jgi:hypothetical protein
MNINDFISHLKKKGVAKTSKFKVFIYPPLDADDGPFSSDFARDFEFSCESVEFPGRTLTTNDTRIYGASFKTPFGTDYAEVNMTFLCNEKLEEKQFFDKWINYINPIATYDFKYKDEYASEITIIQYNEMNKPTYACKLVDAFPISVSPLSSNWSDDNIHRVQVAITYRDWNIVNIANDELV